MAIRWKAATNWANWPNTQRATRLPCHSTSVVTTCLNGRCERFTPEHIDGRFLVAPVDESKIAKALRLPVIDQMGRHPQV